MQVETVHLRDGSQDFRHGFPIVATSDPKVEIFEGGIKRGHEIKFVRDPWHEVFAGRRIVQMKFKVLSDGDQSIASFEFFEERIKESVFSLRHESVKMQPFR